MKNIQKGQWLFTCSMQPLQFLAFDENGDDFTTMNGSKHSVRNCSCKIISENYAKWFIDNKIEELFAKYSNIDNRWELYENEVKELCKRDNIIFEGI